MSKKIMGIVLVVSFLFVGACAGTPKTIPTIAGSDPAKVLAVLDGVNISEKDVLEKVKNELQGVQTEIYKIEKSGLDQLINEKLLEKAAAKEGKSKDAYMNDYLSKNLKDPTEDEMKQFYEFRKAQMGDKKFEEVKQDITDFLKNSQRSALQQKLYQTLRAEAKIEIKLEPPRVELDVGDGPSRGPKDAPVTVIEFSDYQCPFCSRSRPTVNQIIETYPKEVRYVFMDFPLNFHKDSAKAHEAAHCAGDQGKYWEMNKELFANQTALGVGKLKEYAKKTGLDMKKFDSCLDSGKYTKKVAESLAKGQSYGVSGTPAFFVNGVMISGARPFPDFKEAIDSELKRK